jgi:hypothetical protein
MIVLVPTVLLTVEGDNLAGYITDFRFTKHTLFAPLLAKLASSVDAYSHNQICLGITYIVHNGCVNGCCRWSRRTTLPSSPTPLPAYSDARSPIPI